MSGAPAFSEELWSGVGCGGVTWRVGGPCRRCTMITVEQVIEVAAGELVVTRTGVVKTEYVQDSGVVTKEPLRSLAQMKNRNFNFGVHSSLIR